MNEQALTATEVARMFGCTSSGLGNAADDLKSYDFRFRRLERDERDEVILSVLQRIGEFKAVGAHRHAIWTDAWADVARRYVESGGALRALEPHFMGATPILRLLGDYAKPYNPTFELDFFRVFRRWLFDTYLHSTSVVHEFGCGSGFNLVALTELRPETSAYGWDWAESAVELLTQAAIDHRLPIRAGRFDFFEPDPSIELGPGTAAMTFCALEQTGDRCEIMLQWLLSKRPDVVISMEPIAEFYDKSMLYDYLALTYHQHRGYLRQYLGRLRDWAAEGRIEILSARRLGFGSLFHEGYSLVVWRPC